MSSPVNVTGAQSFNDEVLTSQLPVLVDFWAPWCGPCQMMAPVLESLAKKFDGKIKFVKVDTEQPENHELANQYQIQSIPNMKLFQSGKVVKDFVGFRPEDAFANELSSFAN